MDARPQTGLRDVVACAVIVLMVVLLYGWRLPQMSIRGEESRRATVAMEMRATGNYVVPTQQGQAIFMSARPPLQSWLMAGIGALRGQVDAWAVRLPSVVAIGLIALLLYAYARTALGPVGAFAAACVYLTFGQVLELGRLGETDAVFTFFLAGSLILWHLGVLRQWHPSVTWGLAWLFVAGGVLTKGPQAPVYFVAVVGAYRLVTWRWPGTRVSGPIRGVLTWNPLGALVAVGVVALWLVPYAQQTGRAGVKHIFTGDVAMYVDDWTPSYVLNHLVKFPFEVLGSLLPWSLLLVGFARQGVRRAVRTHGQRLLYPLLALAVTFPSLWLIPGARNRFYMPLYPMAAMVIAWVIDRLVHEPACVRHWHASRHAFAVGMGITAVALFIFGWPLPGAVTLLALLGLLASRQRPRLALLSIAAFTGAVLVGVVTTEKIRTSVDTAGPVASLKRQLPPDATLMSLGPVAHLFAYHYQQPIPLLPPDALPPVNAWIVTHVTPDFPHEVIARIDLNRKVGGSGIAPAIILRRSAP